jgi:hypothetical protein
MDPTYLGALTRAHNRLRYKVRHFMPLAILSNPEIYSLMSLESDVNLIEGDFKHANIPVSLLPYHPKLLQPIKARAQQQPHLGFYKVRARAHD